MLGKGGIRASQRVDYSDYVDENQDADKITYEENSLPHTKPQSRVRNKKKSSYNPIDMIRT